MLLKVAVPIFLALFLAAEVAAIIPLPCAEDPGYLENRTCCPTPNIPGAGPCGENLNPSRGSCVNISVSREPYNTSESDVRKNWPIQYFEEVCVCNPRYGGYDCGECSYGYNDGDKCEEKTTHKRVQVCSLDKDGWKKYREALMLAKRNPSRYMVEVQNYTSNLSYLVRPTTYDLFVWLHHFVAKDNEDTKCKFCRTIARSTADSCIRC